MADIEDKLNHLIKESYKKFSDYKFNQEIPKGPNPLKLSKWYANEISEVTEQIDSLEKDCNISCTCSKGCSACCNQLIVLGNAEILAMSPVLENLDSDELYSICNKIKEQCSILEDNYITDDAISNAYSEEAQHDLQEKYFKLGLKCPLLNSSNECIIYKVRPCLCWSYKFYGDNELCKTSYNLPYSVKYTDWESAVYRRMLTAKKPKRFDLTILQFSLKNYLNI